MSAGSLTLTAPASGIEEKTAAAVYRTGSEAILSVYRETVRLLQDRVREDGRARDNSRRECVGERANFFPLKKYYNSQTKNQIKFRLHY
jgi:hypothetical protein